MTLANTLLQYYVEDAYRGRVMALYMMEWGLSSFAVFFAAVLVDRVSAPTVVGWMAVILAVASVLSVVMLPKLRRLD
jgi:spore maturation protein SpmB